MLKPLPADDLNHQQHRRQRIRTLFILALILSFPIGYILGYTRNQDFLRWLFG